MRILFFIQMKSKNQLKKKVTFSPQPTNVREYNSPYCDPFFMSSPTDDVWRQRIRRHCSNVAFDYAEEVSPKYNDAILCTYFLYHFRFL